MFSEVTHRDHRSLQTKLRIAAACAVLVTTSLTACAFIVPGSPAGRLTLNYSDAPYSWESDPGNLREREHQVAAKFLAELNFYEDGHGLVLPPTVTKERLESTFGIEEVTRLSGIIHEKGRLIGLREEQLGSTNVLVAGCALCHVGKAAGIVIPGLGSKTADLTGLAKSTYEQVKSAKKYDSVVRANDADWQRADAAGYRVFTELSQDQRYDSGTAGSFTQFFALEQAFKQLGLPAFDKPLFAPAKAPSLWGYGPKREVGVFSDGFLKGAPAGAAGVPLFIGNYTFDVYEKNMHKFEEAEQHFEKFLPPKYPFEVSQSLISSGRQVFETQCAQCHGEHHRDQDDLPIYTRPKLIDVDEVGTDGLRLTVYDDEVRKRVAESPLGPYLQTNGNRDGYLAPNLWGVWARFPYLHNGSVANMRDLLTPPEDRPKYIDLVDIGDEYRFDQQRLGATPTDQTQVLTRVKNKDRWLFNANREGFGNGGHDFGTDLNDDEKRALIEYLKTL